MTVTETLNDDSKIVNKNQEYWVPDKENLFLKAKLLKTITKDKEYEVEINLPNSSKTKITKVNTIIPSNAPYFDNVENLSQLPNLNEPSVLNNLQHRFKDGKIYTYSGLFLVAVNPYKHYESLFTDSMIQKYHLNNKKSMFHHSSSRYAITTSFKNKINTSNQDEDLPPHVFAIAEEALHNLFSQQKDQSILVTGESGAGKTENTKKILQYLTNVLQYHDNSNNNNNNNNKHSKDSGKVNFEDKILESNPILESFGNATTVKNNNSSRFGKFIKVFFNLESKMIEGTFIDWYLLEKSRVTFIDSSNERNYHIFYQLLKGIDANPENPSFKNLQLDSLDYNKWNYLKTSKIENNIDDLQEFNHLLAAFDKIGFSQQEQNDIYKVLSAILHLGNISFSNKNLANNSDKQALLSDDDHKHLEIVANLLGIEDTKEFEISITSPKVTAGKEKVKQKKTCKQSKAIIDSLAKIIYEKLFGYIVSKINDSLKHNSADTNNNTDSSKGSTNFIGLLDIAGFEIFEKNSLEQLLINFTNENLQQFFNHHMFVLEQEEYMKENIMWNFKDYGLDLQHTIDLLALKPKGILPLLDEESIMPNSNDDKFYDRLLTTVASNPRFQRVKNSSKRKSTIDLPKLNNFIIKHYAGDVEYDSCDWLHKNKEPLNDHLQQLLLSSNNELLQLYLFAEKEKNNTFKTQCQRHAHQLSSLISNLSDANPHFIRCILPNRSKSSSIFDKKLVLDQLTCNGVLEGIRISREGFPNRIIFENFVKTYSILLPGDDPLKNSQIEKPNFKQLTEDIMASIDSLSSKNDDFKIGTNKILFRSGKLAILEDLKQAKLTEIVGWLVSKIKGDKLRLNLQNELKRIHSAKILSEAFKFHDENLITNGWFKLFTAVKPLLEDEEGTDGKKKGKKSKKLADILSKNQELIDMVNSLETKLETVKENSNKISEINLKLEDDIAQTQTENETLLNKLTELDQALQTKLVVKDDKIKELTETHEKFEVKIKQLITQSEEVNSKEIELNANIESLQTQKASIEKDLIDKNDTLKQNLKEIESLQKTKEELETKIKNLEKLIKERDEEIQKLKTELNNNDNKIDSKLTLLEKNFNDANNKVKLLIDENQIARSELFQLKQEKLKIEKDATFSSSQLSKNELKMKQLEREVRELNNFKKINIEQQSEKHKQQIGELVSEQDSLRNEYNKLLTEYNSMEKALKQSESKLAQAKTLAPKQGNVDELKITINKLQTQLYNEKLDTDYIHQKTLSLTSNKENCDLKADVIMAELMDLKQILQREQKEKNDSLSRIKFLRTKLAGANMDNDELSHKVSQLMNILHENKISLENVSNNEKNSRIQNVVDEDISILRKKLSRNVLEFDQLKEKLDKEVLLREKSENQRQILMQRLGSLMMGENSEQQTHNKSTSFSDSVATSSFSSSPSNSNGIIALKSQLVDLRDSLDLTSTNLLKAEQKIIQLQQNESSLKMTIVSLNQDLEASNKQNHLYSQSILEYKEDYQQISEEILELENKFKHSQLRIHEQNEKLYQMETNMEQYKEELQELNKDKLSKEDHIIDLEDSLSSKEIELEKLKQLNELLKDDLAHMKATLQDFSRDSDLINKIEVLNGKLSKMSRNDIELNKKISNLEYDLDNLEKEHELKLNELTRQNDHYLKQNNDLLSLNQDLKKKILELTEATSINNNEINKLNEIIDSNIAERDNLIKERDSLMDSLDMKDSEIENYMSDLTNLKKTNEEIVEKLNLRNNSLKRHEDLIKKLNDENEFLQNNLDKLKEELIDLEKENSGLGNENDELRDHINDMNSQLNGRSNERDSWNGKLGEMNMRLSKETESKYEQIKENKKLINEIDEVNAQLDKCVSKLELMDKEKHQLLQNLQSKEISLNSLNSELLDERNKNKRNESVNQSLERKLASMEQEIELWKSRYYSKVRE